MPTTWVTPRSDGTHSAFQASARCAARSTSGASSRPGRCTAPGQTAKPAPPAVSGHARATAGNRRIARCRSNPNPPGRAAAGITPTGTPSNALRDLWPVGQLTCRHEWDSKVHSQLSRVLGRLCTVIDDAAQTAVVVRSVPLDQEIHPVGKVP